MLIGKHINVKRRTMDDTEIRTTRISVSYRHAFVIDVLQIKFNISMYIGQQRQKYRLPAGIL